MRYLLLAIVLFSCAEKDPTPASIYLEEYTVTAQIEQGELTNFHAITYLQSYHAREDKMSSTHDGVLISANPIHIEHGTKFGEVQITQEEDGFKLNIADEVFTVYPEITENVYEYSGKITGDQASEITLSFYISNQ